MYVKISEKGVTDFQVYIIRWEAAWSRRALKKNLEGGLWISIESVRDRGGPIAQVIYLVP